MPSIQEEYAQEERWKNGIFEESRPTRIKELGSLVFSAASIAGMAYGINVTNFNSPDDNLTPGVILLMAGTFNLTYSAISFMNNRYRRRLYDKCWKMYHPKQESSDNARGV